MLNGGHIAGWAVEDPALIAQIEDALAVLGSQEEFDKKYPDATRRDPLTLPWATATTRWPLQRPAGRS